MLKHRTMQQKIALFTIAAITVGAVTFLLVPVTQAKVSDFASSLMLDIVRIMAANQVEACKEIMLGTSSGFYDAVIGGETSLGVSVSDALMSFGMLLGFVYCTVDILKDLMKGEPTWEMFTNAFLKITITFMVLLNINLIAEKLEALGAGIVDILDRLLLKDSMEDWNKLFTSGGFEAVQGATEEAAPLIPTIDTGIGVIDTAGNFLGGLINGVVEGAKDVISFIIPDAVEETFAEVQGFWQTLSILPKLILPWCLMQFYNLWVKTTSYALFFELAIRRAFMPIAVANITSRGMRSPGIRYLKKYLSVFLKMMMVLMSLSISWYLVRTAVLNSCGTIWDVFNVPMVQALTGPTGAVPGVIGGEVILFDCIMILTASHAVMNSAASYADDIMGTVGPL